MLQPALSQALGGSTINTEDCLPGLLFTNKRKHPSLYKHSLIPLSLFQMVHLSSMAFSSLPTPSLYPQTAVRSTVLTLMSAFCLSFKRRPVRVISRSQFKWTVCASIGGHWNASPHVCRGPSGWSPCSSKFTLGVLLVHWGTGWGGWEVFIELWSNSLCVSMSIRKN